MGISFSTNRRRAATGYYAYPPPPPHSHPHDYPHYPAYPPPFYPAHPPASTYTHYFHPDAYSSCNYASPLVGQPSFASFHTQFYNGWPPPLPPSQVVEPPTPPVYIGHQEAKKINSDVNVHKDTLKLEIDELNPGHHLVSFVFDALFEGSITIYYFAKEEANGKIVSSLPEVFVPVKIPFQRGLRQTFHQPSGTGIDLGFFVLEDISNPSPRDGVFPLVISAETYSPPLYGDDYIGDTPAKRLPQTQITQAVLEKNHDEQYGLKVIGQILWTDGIRYELREIYGIGKFPQGVNDSDTGSGRDCVICMTEPKDTAALPCRHMCMCSSCAKELRRQSNKCPICRELIEELLEIKINTVDQ